MWRSYSLSVCCNPSFQRRVWFSAATLDEEKVWAFVFYYSPWESLRDGCSWFLPKLHQKTCVCSTHEFIWVKSDLSRASRGSSIHKEEELLKALSPPQTVMWTFLHSERNWTCRKCSVGCEVPSGGVLTQHEQTSGWTKLWVTEEFHTESQKRLPLCRRYLGIQTDNPALSSTRRWPVPAAAAPAGPPPTAGKLSGSSSSHWVTSGRPACIYYHLTTQCWWELLMLIH